MPVKGDTVGGVKYLDSFPPCVCRLLARHQGARGHGQRPLSDEEIAEASGLGIDEVRALSELFSWDTVPVEIMRRFSGGCGVNFEDKDCMATHLKYVRRNLSAHRAPPWKYLRDTPEWSTRWQPLLQRYAKHLEA